MNFNFKFKSSSVLDNENVIFFKLLIFFLLKLTNSKIIIMFLTKLVYIFDLYSTMFVHDNCVGKHYVSEGGRISRMKRS